MNFVIVSFLISSCLAFPTWENRQKDRLNALRIKLPINKPTYQIYNPKIVDWNGVISGCKAACRFEKRLCNFYIRAAAHDSLSVSEGYGGADGSLLLTEDELKRQENNYDNFAFILSKNALSLAKKYDSSVADVIAVCGGIATEFLGGPKIVTYHNTQPFLVGRYDKDIPNPANSLAPSNINTTKFSEFAIKRGLSIEEMTALMGSHSVIDEKSCLRPDKSICDPQIEKCDDISMFKWDNSYFKETCDIQTTIHIPAKPVSIIINKTVELNQELCKFTNKQFKDVVIRDVEIELQNVNIDIELVDVELTSPVSKNEKWHYTLHDAWMGKACQHALTATSYNTQIGNAMNNFKDNSTNWDSTYITAYKKMVNIGARWVGKKGYPITGLECKKYTSTVVKTDCRFCNVNFSTFSRYKCPSSCKCSTAFAETQEFYN